MRLYLRPDSAVFLGAVFLGHVTFLAPAGIGKHLKAYVDLGGNDINWFTADFRITERDD